MTNVWISSKKKFIYVYSYRYGKSNDRLSFPNKWLFYVLSEEDESEETQEDEEDEDDDQAGDEPEEEKEDEETQEQEPIKEDKSEKIQKQREDTKGELDDNQVEDTKEDVHEKKQEEGNPNGDDQARDEPEENTVERRFAFTLWCLCTWTYRGFIFIFYCLCLLTVSLFFVCLLGATLLGPYEIPIPLRFPFPFPGSIWRKEKKDQPKEQDEATGKYKSLVVLTSSEWNFFCTVHSLRIR